MPKNEAQEEIHSNYIKFMTIILKSKEEIEKMREAGKILNNVFKKVLKKVGPGVSTKDLDCLAEKLIKEKGAVPAFKNFKGYPAVFCISINNEVVHGIPGPRILKEGDIVGLDLGLSFKGFFADKTITVPVGKISKEAKKLIKTTKKALRRAISEARPGKTIGDIGFAIYEEAKKNGFSVVKDLFGHGIGRQLHEDPIIPNFGRKGKGAFLKEGMTFAIEPMVNTGTDKIKTLKDGWTVVTADSGLSAHFEETVAVTKKGAIILTK